MKDIDAERTTEVAMLELNNVCKSFGEKEVLKGLSFRLEPGEVLGLLAPNGGGKTTTMRIAMGLIPFDKGTVEVFDKPAELGAVRGVGYMPEERGLYPNERVGDQLRYLARLNRMADPDIAARLPELLDELQIAQYKDRKLKELSLGNKQRVQIAAALIGEPRLLILYEPFSGLDPIAVQFFCNLIRSYAARGAGVLFSSHQLDVVEQVANRIGIMKDGQLVFDGALTELKEKNRQSKVVVRFQPMVEPAHNESAHREISFANCPTVLSASVGDNVAELELSSERISAEEIMLSGLKPEEIREIVYERSSFADAISNLFVENDPTEGRTL